MRIGIVCYPTAGGSGVVATELAVSLASRGHDVHLVSYAMPLRLRSPDERVRYHEVEVASYPLFRYPPYDLALASRLAELDEEEGLDLVHVHYAIPHAISGLLVRALVRPKRLPLVTTLHGTDITVVGQERAYHRVTRYAILSSDAVTAVSNYLRDETDRVFGATRPIDVIPNFVDTERFRPHDDPARRALFARPNQAVLLHVSNFRPVKRSPACVEVLAKVVRERDAVLVMVGDGPERAECEARARRLGMRDRVRFVGAHAEVERLLSVADAFLLPSEYESFGLAALEAMACATPPLTFRSGGLPEVVTDGVDGVLAPPGDDDALAAAATALLSDPARLDAMGAAARRTSLTRFPVEKIVPLYEALYERVSAAPPPG
jgi:N-acetyl-alpha-D-glucosaminyl L-malate synthase BshA